MCSQFFNSQDLISVVIVLAQTVHIIMLYGHHYAETEGGYLAQQPSFDMDHDYGFFEMDDLEDFTGAPRESSVDEEDDRHASDEPTQILTPSILEQLSLDSYKWECLFSTTVDGPSFGTFMRNVRGHTRTIVVAKAEDGQIFGAYANDAWSGRGRVAARDGSDSFLFEVPSASVQKGQMSPLAQPSSHVSLGSFIPWMDKNLIGTSPTSALDFDNAVLSSSPKTSTAASIDIIKSSSVTSGFKQVCQLGNRFIGMSDGEVSFSVEKAFTRVSASNTKDRKEFDVVEFEVYGMTED